MSMGEKMEKDIKCHIGPNQRQILRILKRHRNLTEAEIASKVYQKTVKVGDSEYCAISRSLRGLLEKGLVDRTAAEVLWNVTKEKVE